MNFAINFSQTAFYLLLLLSGFSITLPGQHIKFQKTYAPGTFTPGIKNNQASFYDLESLSDDGFATLGFINDTSNFSEGHLVRYDCTGKVLWGKRLGFSGSPTNTNAGIIETPEGDIVFSFNLGTGFFRASILVGRISKDGQTKWMKRIGNSTEFGRDIAMTSDGGFIIAGSTGTHGTDAVADDIYLIKLDALGNVVWSKTFGNPAGTYDEAFAVKLDSRNRIIVTGRCIADTTFQAFILQADANGNPLRFKTWGYHNQRTNAFDLIVDKEDHYLITGFTTLLEDNHASSENDAYLIKVDSSLNTVFANVYEVNRGSDNSTIGEGLSLLDDGGYAIGVSSLGFSTHNVNFPNSPNKNALYVINKNGSIRKIFLYNQHGSQYTRVRKSSKGSVLIGGFSRAYTDRNHSQGLIIKTDNLYQSGCYDIDVTPEVSLYSPTWQVADYIYQSRSGHRILDYLNFSDSLSKEQVLCEEIPFLTPDFNGPTEACPGKVSFEDQSAGPGTGYWLINQDTIKVDGSLDFVFTKSGTYQITRVLQFSCIVKSITKEILINSGFIDTLNYSICEGSSYDFRGNTYHQAGIYNINLPGSAGQCDSVFILNLNLAKPTELSEAKTFCGSSFSYLGNTYDRSGEYNITLKDQNGCDSLIIRLKLDKIYDHTSSNPIELDTVRFCDQFSYKNFVFTKSGAYKNFPVDTLDDCKIESINMVLVDDCNCLTFPNAFTPGNGDDINNDFRPFITCPEIIGNYSLKIFNRWGQEVYMSNSPDSGWDGFKDGKPLPIDTYMYQCSYDIRYNDTDIRKRTRKGSVSLIR
ncbi:MAG: gliding motility-associated C-terminal domain-containing protein [Saprospiraceae bacterium]|nr:gliding motility-associated C-terminal domain-containing protein [Saprospiraceae bacterium]